MYPEAVGLLLPVRPVGGSHRRGLLVQVELVLVLLLLEATHHPRQRFLLMQQDRFPGVPRSLRQIVGPIQTSHRFECDRQQASWYQSLQLPRTLLEFGRWHQKVRPKDKNIDLLRYRVVFRSMGLRIDG